jgi:hypothetical protein
MSGGADDRKEPSSSHPQLATKKSDQSTQALVRKSTETKSKMAAVAAILDEQRSRSSKGTFLQSPPISHNTIGPVDQGVGQKIYGNQIQDGGRSGLSYWQKPNVYRHRRIGHDIMPLTFYDRGIKRSPNHQMPFFHLTYYYFQEKKISRFFSCTGTLHFYNEVIKLIF